MKNFPIDGFLIQVILQLLVYDFQRIEQFCITPLNLTHSERSPNMSFWRKYFEYCRRTQCRGLATELESWKFTFCQLMKEQYLWNSVSFRTYTGTFTTRSKLKNQISKDANKIVQMIWMSDKACFTKQRHWCQMYTQFTWKQWRQSTFYLCLPLRTSVCN